MADLLNISHACVTTDANGPGRRFTAWVQGCPRACPGCFNPGLRAFVPRRRVSPEDLAAEALASGPLDGLSLSGGEPFSQAGELAAFVDAVRAHPGLEGVTVVAFSGYTLEELRQGATAWTALLSRLDVLVDGEYREEEPAALPLRGSANQRLLALTPEGERLASQVAGLGGQCFEIHLSAGGEVVVSGFPLPGLVDRIRRRLAGAEGAGV